jgi:preprotein translocase subunit YajC
MDLILLMAPLGGGEGGGGSGLLGFLPLILIFMIFYLLVLRPHSKRQKDLVNMVSSLKQGDRVLTSGGLFGTVVSQKEDGNVFVLKIADQVKVEVAKSAISSVVKKAKEG